jgi:methionyl-tRNA synthetase
MSTPKRYTVTAALPYANGPLHIGHIAGAYLPADIYVRYLRLWRNRDVVFICGSDEHGAAITLRAKKEGITPKEIIDKYHLINKNAFEDFGISFDIYHRTSDPLHYETAQEIFTNLLNKGKLTVETTEQFYDEQFNQFLADRYIMGTCPKCANPNAYGDQCEKCGSSLSPTDLINPRSILSNSTPVLKETKHWFLPMQNSEAWVKEWIETGKFEGMEPQIPLHDPEEWKGNVKGQCLSWLKDGLRSRSMTRDLDWGVPVPLKEAEGKVLYVWLDAPIGYISATKQWAKDKGKDWEPYWKDKETKMLHFIGKDNIVFHCIIFPIILKENGGYILPDNIPANEFLNLEGDKISTSRNHAVWLHEYLEDFPGKKDELRYVLNSIAPENGDSEFTWKDFQTRVNSELLSILGNYVNRVMVLYHKYFAGKVESKTDVLDFTDKSVHDFVGGVYDAIGKNIEEYKFRQAQFEAMELARFGNKYLTDLEPWKLFASDPGKVREILNNNLILILHLGAVIQPFMPDTAKKIFGMVNMPKEEYGWMDALTIPNGHQLNPAAHLFTKIEDELIEKELEKLQAAKKANMNAANLVPQKEHVTYDEFSKMDIRVGTILTAEKVAKTKKLMKLTINTGIDERTVVSGIAEYYSPEEVIGKQILILVNLQPRMLQGIESQGMILMAEAPDGTLKFVSPAEMGSPNGAIVK